MGAGAERAPLASTSGTDKPFSFCAFSTRARSKYPRRCNKQYESMGNVSGLLSVPRWVEYVGGIIMKLGRVGRLRSDVANTCLVNTMRNSYTESLNFHLQKLLRDYN